MIGPRQVGIELRPCRPRSLADIHVTSRINGKSVRRQKFSELRSRRRFAETADQLALMIDDADAGTEVGDIAADRGGRPDLADI